MTHWNKRLLTRSWPTIQLTFMQHVNARQFVAMVTRNYVTSELWSNRNITFLAYSPYFEKVKLGLSDHPPPTFEYPNQSLRTSYVPHGNWVHLNGVLHKSLPSVCVFVCSPPIVARQRVGKDVTAATNTHPTIQELLDASFYMRSASYHRKVGD
jgi:hypothetical protein